MKQESLDFNREPIDLLAYRQIMEGNANILPEMNDRDFQRFQWRLQGKDPDAVEKREIEDEKNFSEMMENAKKEAEEDEKRREEARRSGTYDYLTEEEFKKSEWRSWERVVGTERSVRRMKTLVEKNIQENIREYKELEKKSKSERNAEDYYLTGHYLLDLLREESEDFSSVFINEFLNGENEKEGLTVLLEFVTGAASFFWNEWSGFGTDLPRLILKILKDVRQKCERNGIIPLWEKTYNSACGNGFLSRKIVEHYLDLEADKEKLARGIYLICAPKSPEFFYFVLSDRESNDLDMLFRERKNILNLLRDEGLEGRQDENELEKKIEEVDRKINELIPKERGRTLPELIRERLGDEDATSGQIEQFEWDYFDAGMMRQNFEQYYGFELSDCSLNEQFLYYRFVQQRTGSFDEVKDFTKKFGKNGLRTFLALQYDKSLGDRILALSDKIGEEQCKNLFALFSSLVEGAWKLSDGVENFDFSLQKGISPDISEKIPRVISEAVIRRAKDALLAAEKIGTATSELEFQDLKTSFEGVSLFLSILNDLNEKKVFSFEPVSASGGTKKWIVRDISANAVYALKAFVRPEQNADGQARINLELDFNTEQPNNLLLENFRSRTVFLKKNETADMSSLRFAIDLDAVGGESQVSFDMGRSDYEGKTLKRTGDKLGRILSLADAKGSHNPYSFDKKFADPTIFKGIAESFKSALARFHNYPVSH